MMDLLETLVSNGLSDNELRFVLKDLIDDNDEFEDDADQRRCVALAWYKSEVVDSIDPSDCMIVIDDIVYIGGRDYRVLTFEEANEACKAIIEASLWTFTPEFLSETTGIDASVFEGHIGQCQKVQDAQDAQDAIESIIKGSCGLDYFSGEAISADGRGHFLATYDGNEIEFRGTNWFLYRVS